MLRRLDPARRRHHWIHVATRLLGIFLQRSGSSANGLRHRLLVLTVMSPSTKAPVHPTRKALLQGRSAIRARNASCCFGEVALAAKIPRPPRTLFHYGRRAATAATSRYRGRRCPVDRGRFRVARPAMHDATVKNLVKLAAERARASGR